ncbi:MAG: disulfide bond formation protein DsbA [Pelagibacteraceae bacterium]|nr:disulfide bond formation protein DsbA [Pelagibacteraceae bacterium]|tara:strand:- start:37067 stop:37687 length:621 start_codon:yes stop_codon:yes gene_type:complete
MNKIIEKFFINIIFLLISSIAYSDEKSALSLSENDFVIGDENAPITIIEYASMSCSHCADFHVNTLPQLKDEYIDTGKVKFVFRDFPFNYPALLGSMTMRCISDSVRYDYMNALYKLQKNWVVRENIKTKQELYKIMQSGGMSKKDFDSCIQNIEIENDILEGVMLAQKEFNIKSTPSFLVNDYLIEGNKSIKEFRQIIDKILSNG